MSTEILTTDKIADDELRTAFPTLSDAQLTALARYGEVEQAEAGAVLSLAGTPATDLFVVLSGTVEVIAYPADVAEGTPVLQHRAGSFVGEFALLTGQSSLVTTRVVTPATLRRITHDRFRRLIADEVDLSTLILHALVARRDVLRSGGAARTIELIGDPRLRSSIEVRTYLARQRLPFTWTDASTPEGHAALLGVSCTVDDLPVILTARGPFTRTTPARLAGPLGLDSPGAAERDVDLAIVGAGPAGMSAAVYGASEGLSTIVLDAVAVGGQAALSARVENYLGFPDGISGEDLLERARLQAVKFGAEIYAPTRVTALRTDGGGLRLDLGDGTSVAARAVLMATGVEFRSLPLDGWSDLERTSIFYSATELEVRACAGESVVVVGGANSAGQASLFLAGNGLHVTLLVRSTLDKDMSSYLADRVRADPGIDLREHTVATAVHGRPYLTGVDTSGPDGNQTVTAQALFCFIGARPTAVWAPVAQDPGGFVLTDVSLPALSGPPWDALGRGPLPFETSVPGVFAIGDVRSGSMKRVAAAVGEGASAVHSVHRALGVKA